MQTMAKDVGFPNRDMYQDGKYPKYAQNAPVGYLSDLGGKFAIPLDGLSECSYNNFSPPFFYLFRLSCLPVVSGSDASLLNPLPAGPGFGFLQTGEGAQLRGGYEPDYEEYDEDDYEEDAYDMDYDIDDESEEDGDFVDEGPSIFSLLFKTFHIQSYSSRSVSFLFV